jgi:ribose/xylose/arabinose/galactoside ABC-type transport system permease subunit
LIILFIFYAIAFVVLRRTAYGAYVSASGSNQKAAWLSGVNVSRIKVATYILAGMLAEILGLARRILVMREGRIAADLDGRSATQAEILREALGETAPRGM